MDKPILRFIENEIAYTGEQLRSHWAYETFDILGDSAVAFVGPCDVHPEHMKDIEDLKTSSAIRSESMLHFIVEHFGTDIEHIVLKQHLLMAVMAENLNRLLGKAAVRREGSDLYDGDRKLTVSVATVSPVSGMIHAGINISSRNTPVPTRGLEDYGISVRRFAEDILTAYAAECDVMARAGCKVKPCR